MMAPASTTHLHNICTTPLGRHCTNIIQMFSSRPNVHIISPALSAEVS